MLCLTMEHRPISHLIQSIVQIFSFFFFFFFPSILDSERKEEEKYSIELHMSTISLVVRSNSRGGTTDLNEKAKRNGEGVKKRK